MKLIILEFNIMKLIDPLWFFIALCLGILSTYLFDSEYTSVIRYPHPGKDIIYQDFDNNCYKYVSKEVKCPLDEKKIKEFKIQH